MAESPSSLIQRAISGDASALRELLEHYGQQIWCEIRGQIGRQWQAAIDPDDVMQVTYIEVFLRINTFTSDEPAIFKNWLRRIAQNNLMDAIKVLDRKKRPSPARQVRPPDGDQSRVAFLHQLGVESTTPSRVAAAGEARGALDAALDRLPPHYATVVRLYDLQGREASDVARELGRSPAAVHMLRARAHDHLRTLMGGAGKFLSDM